MGSTTQPINQNLMNLYNFHQFLKKYRFVLDARSSHIFETFFVEVSDKKLRKIDLT